MCHLQADMDTNILLSYKKLYKPNTYGNLLALFIKHRFFKGFFYDNMDYNRQFCMARVAFDQVFIAFKGERTAT